MVEHEATDARVLDDLRAELLGEHLVARPPARGTARWPRRAASTSAAKSGSPMRRACSARKRASVLRAVSWRCSVSSSWAREEPPQQVLLSVRGARRLAEHAPWRRRSTRGRRCAGRSGRPGTAPRARRSGPGPAAPRAGSRRRAAAARRGRGGRGARARRVSSRRTRASASRTCADGLMSRPCSSHVYQDSPTPASWATSSRRRPGRAASPVRGKADVLRRHLRAPVPEEVRELRAALLGGWWCESHDRCPSCDATDRSAPLRHAPHDTHRQARQPRRRPDRIRRHAARRPRRVRPAARPRRRAGRPAPRRRARRRPHRHVAVLRAGRRQRRSSARLCTPTPTACGS